MEAKVMTKKQQNNHPGTGYLTEIRTMISGLRVIIEELSLSWRFRHRPAQKTL